LNEYYDETKQNFKNFEDNDDKTSKMINMIDAMIDTMIDTIHATCNTIEVANEMWKATNEPSDNVSKMAKKKEMIVLSYKTINEMNKTFDGTNKMTKEFNSQ